MARITESMSAAPDHDSALRDEKAKQSNAWKWLVGLGCGCFAMILILGILSSILLPYVSDELEKAQLQVIEQMVSDEARQNPDILAVLGEPIDCQLNRDEFGGGEFNVLGRLVGPDGSLEIRVVGELMSDVRLSTAFVEMDGTRIDLTRDGYGYDR